MGIDIYKYIGEINMKRVISIILIGLGLILIITPNIRNVLVKSKTKEINKMIDAISYDDILENQELDVEFNYEAVEDVGLASVLFSSIGFDNKNLIGQLTIPDLDIELPLLKGLTNSNLSVGAATMKDDQVMGERNYSVSGHNMKNKDILFGRLMDIEVGTTVYITDKNEIFEYDIYDTVVVPDTAMYMIEDLEAEKKGKPIISLMTCYYSSKTGKRFFALGELTDKYPMEDNDIKLK